MTILKKKKERVKRAINSSSNINVSLDPLHHGFEFLCNGSKLTFIFEEELIARFTLSFFFKIVILLYIYIHTHPSIHFVN